MISGCGHDLHNHPELTTGKQFFEYHCSECHGNSGKGIFLKGIPSSRDTALSATQIVHKLRKEPGDKMPVFAKMPEAEAIEIALYLQQLKEEALEKSREP